MDKGDRVAKKQAEGCLNAEICEQLTVEAIPVVPEVAIPVVPEVEVEAVVKNVDDGYNSDSQSDCYSSDEEYSSERSVYQVMCREGLFEEYKCLIK